MKGRTPKNLAASVRQRLQNLARERKEDFQLVLGRFALERLLYRLDQSPHHDRFVVKGATLFALWSDQPYRATRDLDLLGSGNPSITRWAAVFRDVCRQSVADDGLDFSAETVIAEVIKPDQEYQGIRVNLLARLERARIPIQIDIGFGDAITPAPQRIDYPSMLGFPTATISIYPKETVIAEKLQAMVMLGMANSRMKDFFDLWVLAQQFDFDGQLLCNAIRATFSRRNTSIPVPPPLALSDEFCQDRAKQLQWSAFLAKGRLTITKPTLPEVAVELRKFFDVLLTAAGTETGEFDLQWRSKTGWHGA